MVFTFINRIRNDDGGQVIIWYALVTLTLVAFVITVADITSWTARKIHLQTSVDAAAFSDLLVAEGESTPEPDFQLVDENAHSPTYQQALSPRDYLQQVTGWYFTYAT